MSNNEKMRREFEAWAKSWEYCCDWDEEIGMYEFTATRIAWKAWQAASGEAVPRDREADRQRWRDPKFNAYLDQAITENGEFTTWDQIDNVNDAWYGYQAGLHDASPGPFEDHAIGFKQLQEMAPMRVNPANGYDAAWCAGFNEGVAQYSENIQRALIDNQQK